MKKISNITIKIFNFITFVVLASVALFSCESSSHLASEIEGEWNGVPERVTETDLSFVSLTPSYEFIRNSGAESDKDAGTVILTAQIDAKIPAEGFQADSFGEAPVSFSVAAISTVKGTWKAIDNDELTVRFMPSSILTSIDSKAVCEYTGVISTTDKAETVELPHKTLDTIERQINATITAYVSAISKLDDIRVKDRVMKLEIGNKDYILTK